MAKTNPKGDRSSNFFAYPNTFAVDFAISASKMPMLKLQFGVGRRRIDFSLGNHLIYGSLVILFETNEDNTPKPETAIYAVIEDFDLKTAAHQHVVGVSFLQPEDMGRFNINKRHLA